MNNPLSFSSVKVELFSKDGIPLKPASGFVVEAGNQYYLVTNRHLLSGREMPTGGPQEPGNVPFILKTSLHIYRGEGEKCAPLSIGMWKGITLQLYDENGASTWIEPRENEQRHPNYWTRVSAISLTTIDADVEYGPPDLIYIIGYPLNWPPKGDHKFSAAFW